MKHFNTIILTILSIAVAALFYLQIKHNQHNCKVEKIKQSSKGCTIAYFEMDSIQNNFEYYKEVIKELSKKEQEVRNHLAEIKNANISKLKEYQGKGNSMSPEQMNEARQDLERRDNDYQLREQTEANKLSSETRDKLLDVKKKIEDYLKEYNKNRTYSFILSNSSDLIYYKDSAYNITADLIKGLNETYKFKKK
ncbi:MAG: OmpH family outer membrane protein [Chitinophagaceae bacterium]|nr:OmpH family outer membrane protein [Chitinophagaceae bacterium]